MVLQTAKVAHNIIHLLLFKVRSLIAFLTSSLIVVVVGFWTQNAFSQGEYRRIRDCGVAKVVSGDICTNLKVQFHFDGCKIQSEPKMAENILCIKQAALARLVVDGYKFEAKFDKVTSSENQTEWKAITGLRQFVSAKKEQELQDVNSRLESEPAPINKDENRSNSLKTSNSVNVEKMSPHFVVNMPDSPWKFNLFANFQYKELVYQDSTSDLGHPSSGFLIEDGSVYATYSKEKVDFVVDLAFRRAKDDTNKSSNNNISIGVDRSQVYLLYRIFSKWDIILGQFDSVFSLDKNDSKDRFFSELSPIKLKMMPKTHTGFLVETQLGSTYLQGFVANPDNKGSYGSSANIKEKDEKTEYGFAGGYKNKSFFSQVGIMTRPMNRASGDDSSRGRILLDLIAGFQFKALSAGIEYSVLNDPGKNTLTSEDSTDVEAASTGTLLRLIYSSTEKISYGLYYSLIKDDPERINEKTNTSYGLGFHYLIDPELEFRTEYHNFTLINVTNKDSQKTIINFALIFSY